MHGLLLAPIIYIIASQPISFQRLFRNTNSVEPVTSESEESTDMKGKKIQRRKWDVQSRKEVYNKKRKAESITKEVANENIEAKASDKLLGIQVSPPKLWLEIKHN